MFVHVALHAGVERETVAAVDVSISEGGIEAAVLGRREPDEVGGSVVEGDAVEMVNFVGGRRGAMPGEGDGDMDEDVAVVLPEFEIDLLASAVGFGAGVIGDGGFELIEIATAEGKDPSVGCAVEGSECRSLERNESHFGSVG